MGWGVPWNVHARTGHSPQPCVPELTQAVLSCTRLGPPSPFHHGRIHDTSCLSEARVTVTVNSSPERKHLFLHGRTTGHFPVLQEMIPHQPRSMQATLIKPRGYKGNKDKDCRSRKGTCWEDTQQWEWKEVERGKWGWTWAQNTRHMYGTAEQQKEEYSR